MIPRRGRRWCTGCVAIRRIRSCAVSLRPILSVGKRFCHSGSGRVSRSEVSGRCRGAGAWRNSGGSWLCSKRRGGIGTGRGGGGASARGSNPPCEGDGRARTIRGAVSEVSGRAGRTRGIEPFKMRGAVDISGTGRPRSCNRLPGTSSRSTSRGGRRSPGGVVPGGGSSSPGGRCCGGRCCGGR